MSAPKRGPHHGKARDCLDSAAAALDEAPLGEIRADVLAAHSEKAQVYAQAAIAHALLDIADALRAAGGGPADG